MAADQKESGEIVLSLSQAMARGTTNLKVLPGLLARVIREDMWRERYVRPLQQTITFATFEAFVTTGVPEGLGSSIEQLRGLCRDRVDVLDLIDQVLQRPDGNPTGANQHKSEQSGTFDNVKGSSEAPTGNSSARALRALRAHAPEQHARVLAGELSPHRAMVEAGLRKPTWTAPADLDDLARALARRYPSDAIIQALLRLEADPVAELQQSLDQP